MIIMRSHSKNRSCDDGNYFHQILTGESLQKATLISGIVKA